MTQHWMKNFQADFLDGEWEIKQILPGYISFHSLYGQFDDVIAFLQKEKTRYFSSFKDGECELNSANCVPSLHYKNNKVNFDQVYIELGVDDEGQTELQVWGKRKPNEIELEWLETDRKNKESDAKEQRRLQLEILKKEFSDE